MATAVSRSINWLLRLDYTSDISEHGLKQHYGRTVDAFEMIDALEILRVLFEDTRRCVGAPMYRGEKEFDFIHDLKLAVNDHFLVGEDDKDSALRRRKNRSLVVLMLNPIIDQFQNSSHEEALESYNEVIDDAISQIFECDSNPSVDDALIVRRMIQKEVARRNRVQEAVDGIMRLRRRKRRKKKK
jgi:hypothetical protein